MRCQPGLLTQAYLSCTPEGGDSFSLVRMRVDKQEEGGEGEEAFFTTGARMAMAS